MSVLLNFLVIFTGATPQDPPHIEWPFNTPHHPPVLECYALRTHLPYFYVQFCSLWLTTNLIHKGIYI